MFAVMALMWNVRNTRIIYIVLEEGRINGGGENSKRGRLVVAGHGEWSACHGE